MNAAVGSAAPVPLPLDAIEGTEVAHAARMFSLQPGDILVVYVKNIFTAEQLRRLAAQVESIVPVPVKVLVLDNGMSMDVLRPGAGGQS